MKIILPWLLIAGAYLSTAISRHLESSSNIGGLRPTHRTSSERTDCGLVFTYFETFLYSEDFWVISTDINITEYYNNAKNLLPFLDKLNFSREFFIDKYDADLPQSLRLIFQREVSHVRVMIHDLLERIENLIKTITPSIEDKIRSPRSIFEPLTDGFAHIFGLAKEKSLQSINQKLQTINNTQKSIIHMAKEQLTFINNTNAIMKEHNDRINNLHNMIEDLNLQTRTIVIDFLSFKVETELKINMNSRIDAFFRGIESAVASMRDHITRLEEGIHLAAENKLSTYLLPPAALFAVISDIAARMQTDRTMLRPVTPENIYFFYSIIKIHAASDSKGTLRLYLEVPLKLGNNYFLLFETHILPTRINNTNTSVFIRPEYPLFAISEDKQSYISMDMTMFSQCVDHGGLLICPPRLPIRSDLEQSCLFSLYQGSKDSINLNCKREITTDEYSILYRPVNSDNWIYSFSKPTTISLKCPKTPGSVGRVSPVKDIVLENSGVIEINPACIAHSSKMTLLSHNRAVSRMELEQPDFHLPKMGDWLQGDLEVIHKGIDNTIYDKITRELKQDVSHHGITSIPIDKYVNELNAMQNVLDKNYENQTSIKLHSLAIFLIIILLIVIYRVIRCCFPTCFSDCYRGIWDLICCSFNKGRRSNYYNTGSAAKQPNTTTNLNFSLKGLTEAKGEDSYVTNLDVNPTVGVSGSTPRAPLPIERKLESKLKEPPAFSRRGVI